MRSKKAHRPTTPFLYAYVKKKQNFRKQVLRFIQIEESIQKSLGMFF